MELLLVLHLRFETKSNYMKIILLAVIVLFSKVLSAQNFTCNDPMEFPCINILPTNDYNWTFVKRHNLSIKDSTHQAALYKELEVFKEKIRSSSRYCDYDSNAIFKFLFITHDFEGVGINFKNYRERWDTIYARTETISYPELIREVLGKYKSVHFSAYGYKYLIVQVCSEYIGNSSSHESMVYYLELIDNNKIK